MEKAYKAGQRFEFEVGDQVVCNDYPGVINEVCNGKLRGMVVVQLGRAGTTCVSASYPGCYPFVREAN